MVDSVLKQRVIGALEQLPPEATLEDLIEQLLFQAKIDRGLADVEAGRVTSHDEVVWRFMAKLKK